jgi:membrane protein DedA with SNARE-associated domain
LVADSLALLDISAGTLNDVLGTLGYAAVFLFIFIESSGIPFPGETMLLTASAYAGAGHLQIPLVILAAIVGAIFGDNCGYLLGRTGGRRLVRRYGHFVRLDEQKLDMAQRYYRRHGDKTVFFGRFVAILRAWSAFLAGLNHMPWPKFVAFDSAGAIVWATLWGVLAFEFGRNLSLLKRLVTDVGIAGVVIIILAVTAFLIWRRRAHRRVVVDEEPIEEPSITSV